MNKIPHKMGTHFPLLLQLSFPTTSHPSLLILNPNHRFSSSNSRLSVSAVRHWNSTSAPRFNLHDDDDDDEELFPGGSGAAKRRRTWWYDDGDYDYDDDWDDDDDDKGIGFSIFKVIRAAAWMLPAIAISLLLGTGPNAFFMALAVPLGQTALSLVFDKVWGSTNTGPKPRSKTKTQKRPFTRSASTARTSARNEKEAKTSEARGSYQSWVAADDVSDNKGNRRVPKFGGWDELDSENPSAKSKGPPKQQKKGKLSKTGRVKDSPLLLRLLIAVSPFLGHWAKFLF